ncbi:hypothetical protein Salat_0921100 [Sesamum alatum]|uniref:Hydroxyproline-rich glycoprotein family protein n=1 Tax=Sesamum alatum TaxID=300844 RepID=A0AAE1YJV3_9LAMI|nr:hypothetical protein Salat_0921100 [Sesamum alatum]
MAERQPTKSERKRERQPISVPFIWEEKPGMPKKDWKPPTIRPIKPAAPPVKLVVSVPFGWEEKPGTPLPSLVQPPPEPIFAPSPKQSIIVPPPATYSDHDYGNWSIIDDQDDNEEDGSSDSELDIHSFETDSFSSAKSLLANGLVLTTELSRAAPVQLTYHAHSGELQSPGSPTSEAESTASSYATGTTSLVGDSFLEWLFPLLVPSSSLPNKVGHMEKDPSHRADVQGKEVLRESNCSQVRRPLLTLEELIVMSRRRSCQRKIAKMDKHTSMVTMSSSLLS